MTQNRRSFLLSTMGFTAILSPSALLSLYSCKTSAEGSSVSAEPVIPIKPDIPLRKSATDKSNVKNIELYKLAIQRMRATPFPTPISGRTVNWWEAHALIHYNDCPHGNWFFLPWHRAYLHFFEKVCREFSGDNSFALPYWDWSEDDSLPLMFSEGNEQSNPLFDNSRVLKGRSKISHRFLTKNSIEDLLNKADFTIFGGEASDSIRPTGVEISGGMIETQPHNLVHSRVSGNMNTFVSPRDPIFWLHHCNIDRLWAEWSNRRISSSQEALPIDMLEGPTARLTRDFWLGFTLGKFYEVQKEGEEYLAHLVTVPVSRTISTSGFEIQFDSVPETKPRSTQVNENIKQKYFGPLNTQTSKDISTDSRTLAIVRPAGFNEILKSALESSASTLRLRIAGIPVSTDPNAEIGFFINPTAADNDYDDDSYVGGMRFFGHDHADHAAEAVDLLDIVPVLRRLLSKGRISLTSNAPIEVKARWMNEAFLGDLSKISFSLSYVEQG